MARIEYQNDTNGSFQETKGSDGRLNVSARADQRAYYNSRDEGRTFTLIFEHTNAVAGEFSAYWKNTSLTRTLVISSIGINTNENSRIKLHLVTGTATGGSTIAPVNLNPRIGHSAEATALQGASGDAVAGITSAGVLDLAAVLSGSHEELRLSDRVRLGEGDAIAIEYDTGTTGDFYGVIFGFYE